MKITLLRPPIISSQTSFSIPVTPPIALAYLAAVLEQEGFDVEAIDCIGEDIHNVENISPNRKAQGLSIHKIVERIPSDTDILGVSIMFSQEWPVIRDLVLQIKKAYPQLKVIAGGEHITAMPEFSLNQCSAIDVCGLGEGEQLIVDFARAINEGKPLEEVSGLCFRKGNEIVYTPKRERIKEPVTIPWPAWDKLPIENYLDSGYGNGINNGRNMPIIATRGCPFKCTFCSNPLMYSQRYTMRPPEDVIKEMKHYIEKYKVTFFEFYDLTAIVKKDWIVAFCQMFLKEKLNVGWSLPSGTRSEALDEEVLSLLYQTNCRYLVYAPESGSEKTLTLIKKKVHLQKLLQSVRTAVKLGINTRCNLIIGFPQERLADVFKTIWFQLKLAWLGVDDAPIFMFSPYPGSELFQYLQEKGTIKDLDDAYFDRLLAQMDLGVSESYCENVSGQVLKVLRISGMCLFYGFSYLFRPARIVRSVRNIFIRRQTNTVFEQRILEMLKRKPVQA